MTTPPPSPFAPLGVWAWRLLPLFALVAAAMLWNLWSTAEEDEWMIRTALESRAEEWAFVKKITGKTLSR